MTSAVMSTMMIELHSNFVFQTQAVPGPKHFLSAYCRTSIAAGAVLGVPWDSSRTPWNSDRGHCFPLFPSVLNSSNSILSHMHYVKRSLLAFVFLIVKVTFVVVYCGMKWTMGQQNRRQKKLVCSQKVNTHNIP